MKKTSKNLGFTIVETVIVFGIISILSAILIVYMRPVEQQRKARDAVRLSDISTLDRTIVEYRLDKGGYPDAIDTLRTSTTLPEGNVGPVAVAADGWIDVNLASYLSKLPIDPVNDGTFHYSYRHTLTGYEVNVVLEHNIDKMQNDGGDDPNVYELGNDLTIL
jgi:type II secretory pathway pseudopilin PulG